MIRLAFCRSRENRTAGAGQAANKNLHEATRYSKRSCQSQKRLQQSQYFLKLSTDRLLENLRTISIESRLKRLSNALNALTREATLRLKGLKAKWMRLRTTKSRSKKCSHNSKLRRRVFKQRPGEGGGIDSATVYNKTISSYRTELNCFS